MISFLKKFLKKAIHVPAKEQSWNFTISFPEEYTHCFSPEPLSEEERKDVTFIVNTAEFKSFRKFLLSLSLGFYRDGREFTDSRTHVFNQMGKILTDVVAQLDSYKDKPEEALDNDPFL